MLVLPWWNHWLDDNPADPRSSCAKCKDMLALHHRKEIGCGYESPPAGRVVLDLWSPPTSKRGYNGERLTVCPGYSTRLPQVIEILRARTHWLKGQLEAFAGDTPDENLVIGVEVLDSQVARVERYTMTSTEEGGGRESR